MFTDFDSSKSVDIIYMIENIFHNFDCVSFSDYMNNLKAARRIGFKYDILVDKTNGFNSVALCKSY